MNPTWLQYLNPRTDRCWFCQKDGCDEFDTEFDTYLHLDCLRAQLKHPDPDYREEAGVMADLLLCARCGVNERHKSDYWCLSCRPELRDSQNDNMGDSE